MSESSNNHLNIPQTVMRPLRLDTNRLVINGLTPRSPIIPEHSPGISQKIKIPKRQYSYEDPLQRMATPMFDKTKANQRKKGPSSAATVLTMAGLFVVGVTLIMSGFIVLIVQTETPFVITGCLFLGVGFAMLLVCTILQRKNVVKFVLDINRDLYFLNMNKSYMWKFMFENRTELPLAHN